ncbi:MAG: flagellin [Planctomycetota bacterium]
MTAFTVSLARVPSYIGSQMTLAQLNQTNRDLLQITEQLSTGLAVNRISDDPIRAATIQLIDQRLSGLNQQLSNIQNAESNLNLLDSALGEVNDLILEAKDIALYEVNSTVTDEEREQQAIVVQSLIEQLHNLSNREGLSGYMFGGSIAGRQPVNELFGGYQYVGTHTGLTNDIGLGAPIPFTLPADNAIGSVSEAIMGATLTPGLTSDVRLSDLQGALGNGVASGQISISIGSATPITVDLTQADTIEDVADMIEGAIRTYETDNSLTVLGAGGVAVSTAGLVFDIDPASSLDFFEVEGGTTGADLGLVQDPSVTFSTSFPLGLGLSPDLTPLTPISAVPGLSLGQVEVENLGRREIVDLSGATTFQDVINAFERTGLGIRVELDAESHQLIVFNEAAAGEGESLSISPVGGDPTAETMGIRTFGLSTPISSLNFGRGVSIVDGGVDPVTGLPDPALDVDFRVVLGDGRELPIDLRPSDMTDIQSVVNRVNSELAAALTALGDPTLPAGSVTVGVDANENGLAFQFSTAAAALGDPSVVPDNNSLAAGNLGLTGASFDPASRVLLGEDRGQVQVDNLFSALIDLRDALEASDQFGIEIAGGRLDGFLSSVTETRALVGGHAGRVEQSRLFTEEQVLLDEQTRSVYADVDFAEASTRFSLLQTQLQAGLQAAAISQQLSLLNFLA